MRIEEIIPLDRYCEMYCNSRVDAEPEDGIDGRLALISKHFYYFGRNAIDISEIPDKQLDHPFEKSGPGHRSDFSEDFVNAFAIWLKATFKVGVHGQPCKPLAEHQIPICPTKVRRKATAK
jgi:hypothetical protein